MMMKNLLMAGAAALALFSAPGIGKSQTIVLGAGDVGDCKVGSDTAVGNLIRSRAGTVLMLGDGAYPNGSASDYANCYAPVWGDFKSRTRPAPGNHEKNTNFSGYRSYWGTNTLYRSFTLGQWLIVQINTAEAGDKEGMGSTQLNWLRNTLANSTQRCKLVFGHHHRWSSGADHRNTSDASIKTAFQIMYDNKVAVFLSGHSHLYERWAPQTPAGVRNDARGVRQLVVGTGGTSLDAFGSRPANSQAAVRLHGVAQLELHAATYSFWFIDAGNTMRDSGSGTCPA
jgi:hypothetical protein